MRRRRVAGGFLSRAALPRSLLFAALSASLLFRSALSCAHSREPEFSIPRLHSPAASRKLPEMFGDFWKNLVRTKQYSCRF